MENEGTQEARGQGLDDSRTQHDLRHHLRNILKAEALLPGFCFRGNSFPGLSQRKGLKQGGGREDEKREEESRGVRRGQDGGGGPGGRGQQMENSEEKDERKGRGRGGVWEKGGRAGQEASAETSVRDGHHSCASV